MNNDNLIILKSINFYEADYMEQWQCLRDRFKKGMIQGIVAFEIEVKDLQGQQKLSQNKAEKESWKGINLDMWWRETQSWEKLTMVGW